MRGEADVLTPEALGLALRDARRNAGLNQTDAAAQAGITRATISAAERGLGGLTSRALLDLARTYGCAIRLAPRQQDPLIAGILARAVNDDRSADHG